MIAAILRASVRRTIEGCIPLASNARRGGRQRQEPTRKDDVWGTKKQEAGLKAAASGVAYEKNRTFESTLRKAQCKKVRHPRGSHP